MFCTKCGYQVADNARFCPGCGAPLQSDPQPPQQPTYSPPPQQPRYAPSIQQSYTAPATPRQALKGKLSTGALICIIAGGLAVIGLLVFFGLRLFGGDNGKQTDAISPKATVGVWRGMLSFDAWFPEDGTSSAIVYASEDGTLPCILYIARDGKEAELTMKDVTIPLSVQTGEHALQFSGNMGDESITFSANPGGEEQGFLTGDGSVTVGGELIPFSLRFTQQSDEAPELSGAAGALPKPPAGGTAAIPAEPDGMPAAEAAPNENVDLTPQSEQEPPALEGILPGTWVTNPDQDFCVTVFAFDPSGLMGHGIASSDGEETLENWDENGVWELDGLTWRDWSIQGDTVTLSGRDNTETVRIVPKNEEWIVVYFDGSDEGYEFHRMGEAPGLHEYMTGVWIPDEADENGVHAVLSLENDGSVVVTGAKGKGNVLPSDWGDESKWEILGTKDGNWRVQDGQVIINMGNKDDVYVIGVNGPDHAVFQYGASWKTAYTRVS